MGTSGIGNIDSIAHIVALTFGSTTEGTELVQPDVGRHCTQCLCVNCTDTSFTREPTDVVGMQLRVILIN